MGTVEDWVGLPGGLDSLYGKGDAVQGSWLAEAAHEGEGLNCEVSKQVC